MTTHLTSLAARLTSAEVTMKAGLFADYGPAALVASEESLSQTSWGPAMRRSPARSESPSERQSPASWGPAMRI